MNKIYYSYPCTDGKHKFNQVKQLNLELKAIVTILFIKMKKKKKDISKDTIKRTGENQKLIRLGGGVLDIYGPILPNKKHINILKRT